MSMDILDLDALDPGEGEVQSAELVANDDVLVKLFALGPDGELSPHEHETSTNVFHVVRGSVTVIRDGEEAVVDAPGVVLHERGQVHGARNDTDEVVAFTANFSPMPS